MKEKWHELPNPPKQALSIHYFLPFFFFWLGQIKKNRRINSSQNIQILEIKASYRENKQKVKTLNQSTIAEAGIEEVRD